MKSNYICKFRKHLTTALTATLLLGVFAYPAEAEIVGVSRSTVGIEADFGDGVHLSGNPTAPFTITWDYTPVNGVIRVTATVHGTLYLDRLAGGRARARILYQTSGGSSLFEDPRSFCGPGGDANAPVNKQTVDSTFSSTSLRRVTIVTGIGDAIYNPLNGTCLPLGAIEDEVGDVSHRPSVQAFDKVNNGNADFGGPEDGLPVLPSHFFGEPSSNAHMSLVLNDAGQIEGRVRGVLYWDNTNAGTARLQIRFRDVNNNNLTEVEQIDVTGPLKGNANEASNQKYVNETFTSASLFKIRLSVGFPSGANGIASAIPRTYSFGPSVGTSQGIPFRHTTEINEETAYSVQWAVPAPQNWHSLDALTLRLIDEQGEILRVRWDEAENVFSHFNPHTGRFSEPARAGSLERFESPAVTLLLAHTEVIGSGPTGSSVVLNLNLKFKPQAVGRTFNVEVLARDDTGETQEWDLAGRITVLSKGQ